MKKQIFLGGTCGSNNWRERIVIPALVERGIPEEALFNPVVEHWTDEARRREDEAKATAAYQLYVIASPDPAGSTANVSAYSLVELVMSLYDAPDRTIVHFDTTGMPKHTAKGMLKAYTDLCSRFPQSAIFKDDYPCLIDWLASHLEQATEGAA